MCIMMIIISILQSVFYIVNLIPCYYYGDILSLLPSRHKCRPVAGYFPALIYPRENHNDKPNLLDIYDHYKFILTREKHQDT